MISGIALILFALCGLALANSDNFYLYSVVSEQNTDLMFSQVQCTDDGDLFLISTTSQFARINDSRPFEGSIWKNGYLNEVESGNKVVIIDEDSKKLKVGPQPGLGPFSSEFGSLRLNSHAEFLACKFHDSDQYYSLFPTNFDCDGTSYIVSLRPELIERIAVLGDFSPNETVSSHFNGTAFTTLSSSSSTSSLTSTSTSSSASSSSASSSSTSSSSASSTASTASTSSTSSTLSTSTSATSATSTVSSEPTSQTTSSSSTTSIPSSTTPSSSTSTLSPSSEENTSTVVASTLYTITESMASTESSVAPTVVQAGGSSGSNQLLMLKAVILGITMTSILSIV